MSGQHKQTTYPGPSYTERGLDVTRQLFNVSLDLPFQDHVVSRLDIKKDESMTS